MPMTTMTVESISTALSECGVTLPDQAQRASDTLAALHAEAERDVVAEAIAAVADHPLTPKTAGKQVQALATALTAKTNAVAAAQSLERPVLEQFRASIVESTDNLIDALRPRFDLSAAVMQAAGAFIEPQWSASDVLLHGGTQAVETYQKLESAQVNLSQVQTAYFRVLELSGYVERNATWFIESANDEQALTFANSLYKRGWHRLAHAGYTLRLNTRAEAAAMVTAAKNGTAAAEAHAKAARIAANRDPLRDARFAQALGTQ